MQSLPAPQRLFIKQVFELAEIFGFESRNKYQICEENGNIIAYAAEQQKGILGFLLRQFIGHWRTFDIHFYNNNRQEFMIGRHPFRWFFQRLELFEISGKPLGVIERRFSIFSKQFEIQDARGNIILEVNSPLWRIWTFPFMRGNLERARISKKWSGVGFELFTDRDNFLLEFFDTQMPAEERALIIAASIYIDLMFFENKGGGGGVGNVLDIFGD